MYKTERFSNIFDLQYFLNKYKIKPDEIIGIYRVPISLIEGMYELLYYESEEEEE